MKSLLVGLLFFAFTQGVQAAPFELNEWKSKELYNILAAYGLRMVFPADMQTREFAKPASCTKTVYPGVSYTCHVNDQYHGVNVVKTGALAKKLYDFLADYNSPFCEGINCRTGSPRIECVYWWPNKDNPPPRRYACLISRIPVLPVLD